MLQWIKYSKWYKLNTGIVSDSIKWMKLENTNSIIGYSFVEIKSMIVLYLN